MENDDGGGGTYSSSGRCGCGHLYLTRYNQVDEIQYCTSLGYSCTQLLYSAASCS